PYWAAAEGHSQTSLLFDLDDDPAELHDLTGTATEVEMVDLLRAALGEIDAPGDQLVRLGLS
ncbi:MAG: sulfatase, partial [Microthrixaceae bacterium]|nr:sulfatase [Microthrixaceae bacterium]